MTEPLQRQPPPPPDRYPQQIERVVRAFIEDGKRAGKRALVREKIAEKPREIQKGPRVSRKASGRVFQLDGFICRYCGGKVIPTPIMQLLGGLYPNDFPFHTNWKGGLTHPAIGSRSAIVDHIRPAARGGPLEDENLATACWPCNARKGDLTLQQLGWKILPRPPRPRSRWDGLTGYYERLWRRAGRPDEGLHLGWMEALGCKISEST